MNADDPDDDDIDAEVDELLAELREHLIQSGGESMLGDVVQQLELRRDELRRALAVQRAQDNFRSALGLPALPIDNSGDSSHA